MKSVYLTAAHLVWDGTEIVIAPEVMGKAAPNQLIGVPAERLSEIAGRVCYDSLGKGRSSEEYHKHIHEVKHYSVYEHAHMTIEISATLSPWPFLNRPGLWVRPTQQGRTRVTFNPRVVLDWANFGYVGIDEHRILLYHAAKAWPQIVPLDPTTPFIGTQNWIEECSYVVEPEIDEEKWISLFLSGSRGFSHEMVRHGDFSAISQRSTRFVDESESPWIHHPLVCEYDKALALEESVGYALSFMDPIHELVVQSKKVYTHVVDHLQGWLTKKGVDKLTARKQARGAARGYLGNALETEMIFSASVAQWKRMMRARANDAADAEIRSVFMEVLAELRTSRYADRFQEFEATPAKDGIGSTARECVRV